MFKSKLRIKIIKIREKNNKKNIKIDFNKIKNLFKEEKITKKNIGGYFPVNFEVDDLEILSKLAKNNFKISLPAIRKIFKWIFINGIFFEPLKINKYGIPEPKKKTLVYPDILLVPLVAFDRRLNRLGYGGGYYDRLIERLSKKKKIIKIGLAFSIQEIDKVPINIMENKNDN